MTRADWITATDAVLLAACAIDTYRASGPGGQKRNKTSSAVRLRHLPTGLLVIAEESRSQHDNKAKALVRLRRAFALELREPPADGITLPDCSPRRPEFWPLAAVVLDVFEAHAGSLRDAAAHLGTTTAPLVAFLRADDKLWQTANEIRSRHGLGPLH